MRKTLYFFFLVFFSCSSITKKEENKYFEGFVESKITIYSPYKNWKTNFEHIYGEKLITYINKEGFYSREFIDSNNIIVSKEVYNPDSLKLYFFQNDNDTVKYFDVTKSDVYENISVQWSDSMTILNKKYRGVTSVNKYHARKSGKSYEYITTTYNNPDYKISPKAYKNIRTLGIEKMFEKSPFVSVGTTIEFANFAAIKIFAARIVPSEVQNLHFKIPKNVILIEQ